MTPRQPFIARDFYSDPRRQARSALVRALSRPLRRAGFDLELRTFYSPIPDLAGLPEEFWERPSEMPGIDIDLERAFSFVEDRLGTALAEFRPPREATADRREFFLDNELFQGGDADLLYAVIRRERPHRVLELGTGFSTLAAAAAVRANRAEGHDTTLTSCDPHAAHAELDGLAEVIAEPVEALGRERFEQLGDGDVLFIDSSHTVRAGGDVVHLLCEVIPSLAPGVLIHLHDVFLPYPYPREWFEHNRWYWAEQYLLQALLAGSRGLKVLIPAHAMWRADPQRLRRAIPNIDPAHPPISFWIRTRAG